jgi:hypothetical protein
MFPDHLIAADNGNPAAGIIGGLIGLAALAFVIYAFVDMVRRPSWAWDRAGSSKTTWIVLMAVFFFFCGIVDFVMSIIWFASIRGKVEAAERQPGYGQYPQQPYSPSSPSGQGPGAPPPPGAAWTPPQAPGAAQPWGGTSVPPPSPQGPPMQAPATPSQAPPPAPQAPPANACASCGTSLPPNASFCPNCGQSTAR